MEKRPEDYKWLQFRNETSELYAIQVEPWGLGYDMKPSEQIWAAVLKEDEEFVVEFLPQMTVLSCNEIALFDLCGKVINFLNFTEATLTPPAFPAFTDSKTPNVTP